MALTCHTYTLEGGLMNKIDQVGFVHDCLVKLSELDQEITLLDPAIHKERIAQLREECMRIQIEADRELTTI